MKLFRLLVLVALVAVVKGWDGVDDSDVLVLTKSNFDSIVDAEELMLVEFYAPWCGHCKKLAPEYAKAATALKADGVKLAKVDAQEESSLGSKFSVSGYPTLKVFRNGQASDYGGPRDAAGIVSYMRKQIGPSSKELKTVAEADALLNGDDVIVTGFFVSKTDADQKAFLKTADALRDKFKFAHTNDEEVLKHFDFRSAIVMFRPYDERKIVYSGKVSQSALTDWIYKNFLPIAGPFTKDNMEVYQRRNLPILKLILDNVDMKSNKKQMEYYLNRLRKVAKEFPELSYTVVDRKEFLSENERFGLTGSEQHQIVIDDIKAGLKYKHTPSEKFSVDLVKDFVKAFDSKSIKAYIKSESAPEPASKGEVSVVVGETFKDIVLDETKDVMIELYAPWCGHCKALAPKYDQLAKEMEDIDSVVIAKMDATANDSPHSAYSAKGYPTILFAPANKKDSPLKYEGEREVAAMKKWILEKGHTTKNIKKDDKKAKKAKKSDD